FADYTIVFIGYGGSDPDLDNIIDNLASISDRGFDPHYLLVPVNRIPPAIQRVLLDTKRIQIIEYDPANDHEQVEAFVAELTYPQILSHRDALNQSLRFLIVGESRNYDQASHLLGMLSSASASCKWSNFDDSWKSGWFDQLRSDIEL